MKRIIVWLNLLIKKNKKMKRWQRIVTVMAAIITFVTTYALILPAITVEREAVDDVGGMYLEEAVDPVEQMEDIPEEDALIPVSVQIAADKDNAVTFLYEDEEMSAVAVFATDERIPEDAVLVVNPVDQESEMYADLGGRAAMLLDREHITDVTTCVFYDFALVCDGVDVTPKSGLADIRIYFYNNSVEHYDDVIYGGKFGLKKESEEEIASADAGEENASVKEEEEGLVKVSADQQADNAVYEEMVGSEDDVVVDEELVGAAEMPEELDDQEASGEEDDQVMSEEKELVEGEATTSEEAAVDGDETAPVPEDNSVIIPGDELMAENTDNSPVVELSDGVITSLTIKGFDLADNDSVAGLYAGTALQGISDENTEEIMPVEDDLVLTAAGKDYTVKVTCDAESGVPKNASLEVSEIKEGSKEYRKYLEETKKAMGLTEEDNLPRLAARFFDIKIMADDTEITLDSGVTVEIAYTEQLAEEKGMEVSALHFADGPAQPDVLDANVTEISEDGTSNVEFTAESFSVYGVIYTVDFHYEVNGKMYEYTLPGGGFVSFYKLVEVLGISNQGTQSGSGDENATENSEIGAGNGENTDGNAVYNVVEEAGVEYSGSYSDAISLNNVEVSEATRQFVADVASVEFSSPGLVWVGKVDEETTVGGLKEANGLEVQYSAELTEEQITEINAQTVEAGNWALISVLPFDTEESLTVTMKNGEVFTIQVTDAQDDAVLNPNGTVQTIANPAGTTIDLFDYWIVDAYRDTAQRNAWPGHYRYTNGQVYSEFYQFDLYYPDGTYACAWDNWNFNAWHNGTYYTRDDLLRGNGNNQGINANHNFKFTPGVGETVIDGTKGVKANDGNYGVNSWTENASPRPGLVLGTLVDGYPKLTTDTSLGTDGSSLDYLFNSSNGTGKEAYTGVNQLLYVDKDGYYTFDSNDFDAQFNKSSKTFTVSPQTNPTGGARGFWPFGNQVYWHGMHINTQFSMPVDGKVLSPNGNYNDMVFEFQGDDDTWVYVDGVLVGDGGGIHNQTRIVVNFREGTVLVSGEYDVRDDYKTDYHEVKYLDDLYRAAGVYDQYTWVDSPTVPGHQTFAPNSYHTFDMFYLERGGGESNLYIHYNMIATYDFTAHKSYHNNTNDRLYRDEFKFELIGLDGQYKNGILTDSGKAAIMPNGGTEGGSGNVGDAQKVHYDATEDKPGYTYYKVGVSEDGNVNFGVADFSSQEMADCDAGNPSTYRYIIREVVPDEAVNEFGVAWKDATDEEKEEGGFKLDGITYDDKVYYMMATVTRWQENGNWVYGLSKRYYTDDTYTTQVSDNFASFVNGFVQPLTLEVLKMSDQGSKLLEGAEFTLTRAMHTEEQKWVGRHYVKNDEVVYAPVRTATTSAQGTLSFDNLTEGHYILEETAAPEGYETGETSKWLLTLTKQDDDDEIALIPTFTPLNEDGSVAGSASDPITVDSNHTFRYQVLNGKPPVNISVEKQWFDNGDPEPPANASATFALHRVMNVSPVRVELLDSQGVKICDVTAFVGDTVKIYDSGTNDFQHHTPTPGGMAVFLGDNYRDRSDTVTPNDSEWTISTRNIYSLDWGTVVLSSYTSSSNGQYTVKNSDVNAGVVQLHLSENYLASTTYGFDKNPVLYVSNSAGGSSTTDEVVETFTLKAEGGDGDAGNPWKKTFSNLPSLDEQGNEYYYYIVETAHVPANYNHQAVTGNMGSAGNPLSGSEDIIVTNSTAELPKITASKIWKDEDGNVIDTASGLDDLEVKFTLYKGSDPAPAGEIKNGVVTQTITGSGTATWFLLDEHGDVTQYSVRETAVKIPGGDFVDITTENPNPFGGTVTGDSTNGYTITNQLPTTAISVTKQWTDGTSANADKVFDETKTISFTLYQKLSSNDGTVYMSEEQPVTGTVTYTPASVAAEASWSTESISNLPKYVYYDGSWHEAAYYPVEDNIDGVTITYQSESGGNPSETASDAAVSSGNVIIINTDIVVPINILKVDENNTETKLGGAVFKLTKVQSIDSTNQVTEGTYEKTGTTSSEDATKGQLTFEGLTPGYYYLEETESPAGYIKTETGWHFQVDENGIRENVGDANNTGKFQFVNASDVIVTNTPGAALPNTGGPGTNLIYLFGLLLTSFAGTGILMKRRRRKVA